MLLKNDYKKIEKIIGNNNILTSKEECYCYSTDSSNMQNAGKVPEAVVFVKNIEEIQNIMKYAYDNGIPIVSRGAGTNMVGSCVCANGGIVLNFSKMNKILEIDSVNMTATVQPGVVLGNLKSETEKLGLLFPPDPSNYRVSTVGGAIAQSSSGAMAFKYGTTKDYVLSLTVVTSDGRIMKLGADTIKDSVGYHLAQLMVGSEGTLAVIAEATLKLIPKPEAHRVVAAYFDEIDNCVESVSNIISKQIFPAAIDFMDKNSIATTEEFVKCGLNTQKEGLLLVELDGFESSMEYQINKTKAALKESGASEIRVSESEEDYNDIWQARRVSFAAATRLAPDVLSDDIIVPRKNFSKMVKKCKEIADKYNLKMCLVAHAGDGNIHPQIALNIEDEDEFRKYTDAKSEMYEYAISLNGTISAEHGVGAEKKNYASKIIDKNALEYMKMIKKVFDPKNILNPNKII